MNNITNINKDSNYRLLKPITIGEIPNIYLDSLTYLEMLMDLITWCQKVVFPALTETIKITNENIEIINNTLTEITTDINNFKEEITKEYNEFTTNINEKIENFENKINNEMSDFISAINEKINALTLIVNNSNQKVNDIEDYMTNGATVTGSLSSDDTEPTKLNNLQNLSFLLDKNSLTERNSAGLLQFVDINNSLKNCIIIDDGFTVVGNLLQNLFSLQDITKPEPNTICDVTFTISDNITTFTFDNIGEGYTIDKIKECLIPTIGGFNFNLNKYFNMIGLNNIANYKGVIGTKTPLNTEEWSYTRTNALPSKYTFFANILAKMQEIIDTGSIDITADFDTQFNNIQSQINTLKTTTEASILNLQTQIDSIDTQINNINNELEPLIGEVAKNSADITILKNKVQTKYIEQTLPLETKTDDTLGYNVQYGTTTLNVGLENVANNKHVITGITALVVKDETQYFISDKESIGIPQTKIDTNGGVHYYMGYTPMINIKWQDTGNDNLILNFFVPSSYVGGNITKIYISYIDILENNNA